jgi:hypothetical protein
MGVIGVLRHARILLSLYAEQRTIAALIKHYHL